MADKRKTNSEKKQKSQAATLKEVICRLGRYRIFLVFSILLATVSVALTLYIPKLTGHAVDYVIGKGKVNFPGVIQVMIQIGVCTLITALAQWLMNVCNNKMTCLLYTSGLRHGSDELNLVRLDDKAFQDKMEVQEQFFEQLKEEIYKAREEGYENTQIINKSETFFTICDETTAVSYTHLFLRKAECATQYHPL